MINNGNQEVFLVVLFWQHNLDSQLKLEKYLFLLVSTLFVAGVADFIISSSGLNLWHGICDSGYLDFMTRIEDNVPSNLSEDLTSVFPW